MEECIILLSESQIDPVYVSFINYYNQFSNDTKQNCVSSRIGKAKVNSLENRRIYVAISIYVPFQVSNI